ncbi:glutamate synthase [Cutibacterium acnes JCM 18918]|nr:glutamate synthase [Cutibacterium acnes JCM 18918]
MVLEGTVFKTNTEIGVDITGEQLRERFDAVVLATGATVPRMLDAPGIELDGVCYAMEYLTQQNRVVAGAEVLDQIHADGKHVVIIGGGDTATDCVGTAVRQGAASITQLQYNPEPPKDRSANYPWPTYPLILRVSSSNEEGGQRVYSTNTVEIVSNDRGHVKAVRVVSGHRDENRVFIADEGSEHDLPADLVIFAMGFAHPEYDGVVAELGLELDGRGNIIRNDAYETNVPGVFACGDAGRGQSLVVWAIAEGRAAAHGVDAYLKGSPSVLPKPVKPSDRQMTV